MTHSDTSHAAKTVTRGFGPLALIITGVVCFAAGYMVSDLTKALAGGVPEHQPGSTVTTPAPRDADPVPTEPAAGSGETPSTPADPAKTPETKEEEKPAPAGGAGAPPPKG